MAEIWKPINVKYEISNRGRIRGEEIIEPEVDSYGYCYVEIGEKHFVHELVAAHFLAPPVGAIDLKHRDGNKQNNHCCNLEYEYTRKRTRLCQEDVDRIRELWEVGMKQAAIANIYDITQQNVNLIVNGYTWKAKVKQ